MSVAGGSDVRPQEQTRSWPHYPYGNLFWGIATILRPPRGKATPRWRTGRRLPIGAAAVLAVIAAAMVLLDADLAEAGRRVPGWVHLAFQELTDFGKSGWFLWPAGSLLLAIWWSSRCSTSDKTIAPAEVG